MEPVCEGEVDEPQRSAGAGLMSFYAVEVNLRSKLPSFQYERLTSPSVSLSA